MIKSIQQFQEKGMKSLGTAIENFVKDPKDHAGFIYGVADSVIQLGLNIIAETFGMEWTGVHIVEKEQAV